MTSLEIPNQLEEVIRKYVDDRPRLVELSGTVKLSVVANIGEQVVDLYVASLARRALGSRGPTTPVARSNRKALVERRGNAEQVELESVGQLPEIQLYQLEDTDTFSAVDEATPRHGALVRVVVDHPVVAQRMWRAGDRDMPDDLRELAAPIREVADASGGKVRLGSHWETSGSKRTILSVVVEADSALGNTLSREYYWVVEEER